MYIRIHQVMNKRLLLTFVILYIAILPLALIDNNDVKQLLMNLISTIMAIAATQAYLGKLTSFIKFKKGTVSEQLLVIENLSRYIGIACHLIIFRSIFMQNYVYAIIVFSIMVIYTIYIVNLHLKK